jgi:hypothetical protein
MFNGIVSFVANIRGNGIMFPLLDFNPNEPGVQKVEIEGPKGDEIRSTVHVTSVATEEAGRALAAKVNTAALNRIAFLNCMAIENARKTGDSFSRMNPRPGVHEIAISETLFLSDKFSAVVEMPAAQLKGQLEQPLQAGERNFGLFRSARQSESPVEEFMHLYHLLLMLYNDSQRDVGAYVVCQDPTIPQTQDPRRSGVMETVYTRLRNEFAHQRVGVNLENTKAEMADRLGGLIALTKRAIELHL